MMPSQHLYFFESQGPKKPPKAGVHHGKAVELMMLIQTSRLIIDRRLVIVETKDFL